MDNNKIEIKNTLGNLVDMDSKEHNVKEIATLFLDAMNHQPTGSQTNILEFITELKEYYGSPLTLESINAKKSTEQNVWQSEAGSSIAKLIEVSTKLNNESDFDTLTEHILNHYNKEFDKVDFIAELQYLTIEQGGRKTPAKSGHRTQVKFGFTEMQTSGKQLFIDRDTVSPGETVEAKVKIVAPNYFAGSLSKGMVFEFREGAKAIGTGTINRIINAKLEKKAK